MCSPLLVLTFCAMLPGSPEADMTPVLAPAVVVDEASVSADTATTADLADVTDTGSDSSVKSQYAALEPALVVDSIQ